MIEVDSMKGDGVRWFRIGKTVSRSREFSMVCGRHISRRDRVDDDGDSLRGWEGP